jgi:molybdate transport system substrate-binding protein
MSRDVPSMGINSIELVGFLCCTSTLRQLSRAAFIGALLVSSVSSCHAQEITVAAAADLRPALDEIAPQFERESGIHLHVIYGSSGDLFHQIQNGAPFDVFLCANVEYPQKLQAAGLVVPKSYFEYATGKIVLAVRADSKTDLTPGLSALLGPAIRKIAIANPEHAPYGVAAISALKKENLADRLSSKIVTGENISQAASFVLAGGADAGIIALSLALAPATRSQLRYKEIPTGDYSPIVQACVVLNSSQHKDSALKFESYLQGKDAAVVLRRFGFETPQP